MDFVYPYLNGHFMSSYFSFYDFMENVLGIKFTCKDKYDWFVSTSQTGIIYPLEQICIISDRPSEINMKDGRLHNEKGMAIKYTDGFGIWSLNGINVPQWLIETPAEKIDIKLALNEKNTDVQREIIRKVGYERILKVCNAKTLENWVCPKTGLKYAVKQMNVGNINRRYLCYEHASVPGVFYVKCMPPEAKNIVQMRAFQTGIFGFEPEKARDNLRNNKLTDDELLADLPELVQ